MSVARPSDGILAHWHVSTGAKEKNAEPAPVTHQPLCHCPLSGEDLRNMKAQAFSFGSAAPVRRLAGFKGPLFNTDHVGGH